MSAFPIIKRQYYGHAPISTVYGWQMFGSGLGMASGAFLGGVLRDWTGSYELTLVCAFVLSMAGTLSIIILPNTSKPQMATWEDALPSEARSTVLPRPAASPGD